MPATAQWLSSCQIYKAKVIQDRPQNANMVITSSSYVTQSLVSGIKVDGIISMLRRSVGKEVALIKSSASNASAYIRMTWCVYQSMHRQTETSEHQTQSNSKADFACCNLIPVQSHVLTTSSTPLILWQPRSIPSKNTPSPPCRTWKALELLVKPCRPCGLILVSRSCKTLTILCIRDSQA